MGRIVYARRLPGHSYRTHFGRQTAYVRGKTRQVGFKEPETMVAAIDERAASLGMKRSDYLRHLVDEDLKAAGLA